MSTGNRSLAQTLAVQSQVHLPGTVGRLLKQIRDLERVAPLFVKAGLVRPVERPNPIIHPGLWHCNTILRPRGPSAVSSMARPRHGATSSSNTTPSQPQGRTARARSTTSITKTNRSGLPSRRFAGLHACRSRGDGAAGRLIFLDTPLLMDRGMVPPANRAGDVGYKTAYDGDANAIQSFWSRHRERLFPWNATGPVVIGLATERFGAIVQSAQQDLRLQEGRSELLSTEEIDRDQLAALDGLKTPSLASASGASFTASSAASPGPPHSE